MSDVNRSGKAAPPPGGPPDGAVVLFIRAVPSMVKGDTIATIGIPVR